MKTLILMRHANSDGTRPGESDRDRRLNQNGRVAAGAVGIWLEKKGYMPDAALVSSAERTRETWERLGLSSATAQFNDALYLCGPETILDMAQAAIDCETLLILGHNPGIAAAMMRFAETPKRLDVPAAATAVYELPINDWHEAAFNRGRLVTFETPETLD